MCNNGNPCNPPVTWRRYIKLTLDFIKKTFRLEAEAVQWRRRIAKCVIKIGKMLQYHLRSFRRFLIVLFLFSTLMILVNTTVFFGDTVFSSMASLNPNQTTDKTENTGINYKYMECFQQFQVSLFSLRLPSAIDVCVNNFFWLISARERLKGDFFVIFCYW